VAGEQLLRVGLEEESQNLQVVGVLRYLCPCPLRRGRHRLEGEVPGEQFQRVVVVRQMEAEVAVQLQMEVEEEEGEPRSQQAGAAAAGDHLEEEVAVRLKAVGVD
jgi:hypothetical protein